MYTLNDEWEIEKEIGLIEGFSLECLKDNDSQMLTTFKEKGFFNEQYFIDMGRLIEVSKFIGLEGMNISLASIVDEIVPGFISEEIPLTSFTIAPTSIQKQYSVEKITTFSKLALFNPKYRVNVA